MTVSASPATDARFVGTAKPRGGSFAVFLLLAALFYNAVLAVVNAHVVGINNAVVAGTEGLILAAGMAYLFIKMGERRGRQTVVIGSFIVYFLLFLWVSVLNGGFFVKSLRDIFIILLFYQMGAFCTAEQIIKAFRIIVVAAVGVMLVEGFFVDIYAAIFQPAAYYANTRGVEQLSVDSSGLFRNSLGFEGRFSYGLFGQRRLSSFFLEQVSLANFSMVLAVVTVAFWRRLGRKDRLLFLAAILFMITSNSTRTGSGVCLLIFFGYVLFPRLPRYGFLAAIPLALVASLVVGYDAGSMGGDNLGSRVGRTAIFLSTLNPQDFFFGNLGQLDLTADSGYSYMICSETVMGLIYFIVLMALTLPVRTDEAKRFSNAAMLYIAFNLLVGAAIFSIKVSAPLWLVAGFLAAQDGKTRKEVSAS